jgi:hypothetical protein
MFPIIPKTINTGTNIQRELLNPINGRKVMYPITLIKITILLPNRCTAQPAIGKATKEPTGKPKRRLPNWDSDRENLTCKSGILAAQEEKQRPAMKNKLPRAILLF